MVVAVFGNVIVVFGSGGGVWRFVVVVVMVMVNLFR